MAGRYNFVSPGAMAGSAIEQFLVQRELENRQKMQDDFIRQRQAEELSLRQQQEARMSEEQQRIAERQAAMDARAAEAQRMGASQQANELGVRSMMADAIGQAPLTPDRAQQIAVMGFREGVDVPGIVSQAMQPPKAPEAPEQFTLGEGQVRYDATGKRIASGPPRREPVGAARGTVSTTSGPSPYAIDTANRTISAIDGVLPKIGPMTAGFIGSALSKIGGTEAANVSAELSSVASNVAFNAIQAMREASKTGGALGQVSERELDLLSSVEGSIRQNQSPENLKLQLQKVRESMTRFLTAAGMGNAAPVPSHENAGGGVVKWGRDANGRPVRIQ